MTTWECVFPGRPTTKGNSPRVMRFGGFTRVMPSKQAVAAEGAARSIAYAVRPSQPMKGALTLDAEFRFAIPKNAQATKRKPAKLLPGDPCLRHVDRGNLLKCIEDALNGIVYDDDSQIVGGDVSKVWWERDETHIVVRELDASEVRPIDTEGGAA